MNYGLYLSASGVQANMYRQDVFANNLANVQTPAFKVDVPEIRQRDVEVKEDSLGFGLRNNLLDQLGGGAFAGPQSINFSRGRPQASGNPLDIFIVDAEQFLMFQGADDSIRFSRDGRLTVNNQNQLANASSGNLLLNAEQTLIQISDPSAGQITINSQGQVLQGQEVVDTLGLVGITDLTKLVKDGQNMFKANDPQKIIQQLETYEVRPNTFEASAVDQFTAMVSMMRATKSVTANGNMIRYHDLIMDRAVNVLGRVQI